MDPPHLHVSQSDQVLSPPWSVILKDAIVDVIWNIVEECGCFVDVTWNIVEECGSFVDVMWNIVEESGCFVEKCGCNIDPPHLHFSQFDQVLSLP